MALRRGLCAKAVGSMLFDFGLNDWAGGLSGVGRCEQCEQRSHLLTLGRDPETL